MYTKIIAFYYYLPYRREWYITQWMYIRFDITQDRKQYCNNSTTSSSVIETTIDIDQVNSNVLSLM